jgi:hypothetical protein
MWPSRQEMRRLWQSRILRLIWIQKSLPHFRPANMFPFRTEGPSSCLRPHQLDEDLKHRSLKINNLRPWRSKRWRRWKPRWQKRWRCGAKWKLLLRRANHKDIMWCSRGTSLEACTMLAWWRRGLMDNIILSMIQMNRRRLKKKGAKSRNEAMLSQSIMMTSALTSIFRKVT